MFNTVGEGVFSNRHSVDIGSYNRSAIIEQRQISEHRR
jgi:hypothetical protein